MDYDELKEKLDEWVNKVLKTKSNLNGWTDLDAMIEDIKDILYVAFDED